MKYGDEGRPNISKIAKYVYSMRIFSMLYARGEEVTMVLVLAPVKQMEKADKITNWEKCNFLPYPIPMFCKKSTRHSSTRKSPG